MATGAFWKCPVNMTQWGTICPLVIDVMSERACTICSSLTGSGHFSHLGLIASSGSERNSLFALSMEMM